MAAKKNFKNLITRGTKINPQQLDSILRLKDKKGRVFKDVLVDQTFGSLEEALKNLCELMEVEFISDIPTSDISADLVKDIPINYSKNHEVLPFKDEKKYLTVLTSNPLQMKVLDDLRVLFGKPVKFLVTSSMKMQDTINRVYEKSTAVLELSLIHI